VKWVDVQDGIQHDLICICCLVGADGRGFPPGAQLQTCSTCGGRGRVRIFCCETCTFSEQTPGTNYSSTLRCYINEQTLMVYLPIRQPGQSPCVVYRSSIGLSWRIWSMFKTSLLCLSHLGFLGEGLGWVVQECCGFHALTGGDAESFSEAGVHMPIMWRAGPDSPGTMVVICYSMVSIFSSKISFLLKLAVSWGLFMHINLGKDIVQSSSGLIPRLWCVSVNYAEEYAVTSCAVTRANIDGTSCVEGTWNQVVALYDSQRFL
jgi:hypothetical protein